ncbi:hypothetical protein [Streptomyces sp. ME19-01-6]|uniref:hypothetical protein n=1 Tax=Streptomyces sp. ME19-01-6 TaxID=3028686 RepID=UPI0029B77F53|nr:hypothetical protein [Streptomyces sp. ME19-01-6]MDX3229181.1 hypothetical protein [Streptomyces sp. ME19-01-6]
MSELDSQAVEASLRKAWSRCRGDDADDGAEAVHQTVRGAVQPLPGEPRPGWTPEQERQIQATVGQLRKVRDLAGPMRAGGAGTGSGGHGSASLTWR